MGRRKAKKTWEPELSPYEKWMQAEEAKRAGVQSPMFHSQHGGGAYVAKLDNKAIVRTQKLHTKHGVAVGNTNANLESRNSSSNKADAAAPRASSISLDGIYAADENLQGTWGDMGYDGSTHNPLSGNGPQGSFDNRTSAGVENTMIYNDEDMEVGGMQDYSDEQNGYWAEDGQWYTYEEASGGAYKSSEYYGSNGADDSMAAGGSAHNPMAYEADEQVFDDEAAVARPSYATENHE